MKMTTRVAYDNMKYYKSRNLLIGIAIVLTTMLLFVIPTVGKGMIDLQNAAVNQIYPTWHALFRDVPEETVRQLEAHHDISEYGLRGDAGAINLEDGMASLTFLDQGGMDLYKIKLSEGSLPQAENEIVVSQGILEELGQEAAIGDTITVPCQLQRDGGLDRTEEKRFKICGFLPDTEEGRKQKAYSALVSYDFLRAEIPEEQITYRFLFQIGDEGKSSTTEFEDNIRQIASQFGFRESQMAINTEYLGANYVDPVTLPIICGILLIIVVAGIITIYSIYYISLHQRVQEFGRLKSIGATRRQIRQIVLQEGLCVAWFAIPSGLLLGTLAVVVVFRAMARFVDGTDAYMTTLKGMILDGSVNIFHVWIYLLAAVITVLTVYLSLLKPMRMASKFSVVEAMRTTGSTGRGKSRRKGYDTLTIGRLTKRNLMENKKKSLITIVAMALTGVFLMVIATVLSCANPTEGANSSLVGQYEISPIMEEKNREHPERSYAEVQKNNPLTEELKDRIKKLPGVKRVDAFSGVRVTGDFIDDDSWDTINGVPEEYADYLKKGIVKGKVSYEELKSGDKVIVDKRLFHWHPELKLGDTLTLVVHDGDSTYEKKVEIAAVGEYGSGFTNYNYIIMAKEAADRLCENDATEYFHVLADRAYDSGLESSIREMVDESGRLELRTWKQQYDEMKRTMSATSGACYAFLAILSVISVMNLINTMINSVHMRKKELGMMQAIGMSDRQLMRMLQLEGLFYTLGTLLISVGLGSLAGYPVFLYAKSHGMFEIATYHYPVAAAVIMSAVLLAVQILLAVGIARSVRKDSLIERIRFSE